MVFGGSDARIKDQHTTLILTVDEALYNLWFIVKGREEGGSQEGTGVCRQSLLVRQLCLCHWQ